MTVFDGRLALETINYNQVGWDSIHNTNMDKLNGFVEELAAQDPVLDKDLTAPPGAPPSIGDRYIIASVATGAWTGKEKYITTWNGVEWRFTAPFTGMHCWVVDEALYYLYKAAAWSIHEGLTPATTDYLDEGDENLYWADPSIAQGRIGTESGVPVSTTDQVAKGTTYYVKNNGDKISLWNGTKVVEYTFAEPSLVLSVVDGKIYDIFMYEFAGVPTLELSAAWATNTTRTDAITWQNGMRCKDGAPTRKWVATLMASGTNTTEDSVTKRFVYNVYNQVEKSLIKGDGTLHTYNTSAFRYYNNNAANKVAFVAGQIGLLAHVTASMTGANDTGQALLQVGIGLNSTSPNCNLYGRNSPLVAASLRTQSIAQFKGFAALGYNYFSFLQNGGGSPGITTWEIMETVGTCLC